MAQTVLLTALVIESCSLLSVNDLHSLT